MHFPQAINSDLSVLIVCNKTGGTIKKRYIKVVVSSPTIILIKAVYPSVFLSWIIPLMLIKHKLLLLKFISLRVAIN